MDVEAGHGGLRDAGGFGEVTEGRVSAPMDPQIGAALIDAAGEASFAPMLLRAAQRQDAVAEVFAYRIASSGPPVPILSCNASGEVQDRPRLYVNRFHRFDPAHAALTPARPDHGFVRRVGAEEIGREDYRLACFDRPSFVDKLCFGWCGADGATVISFYRREGGSDNPQQQLSALAGVAHAALARRRRDQTTPTDTVTEIETRLARAFPMLSAREVEVCARTLAGWEAGRTAQALGIAPSSVLTYRQRAYQRLGYNRASDFLHSLIRV